MPLLDILIGYITRVEYTVRLSYGHIGHLSRCCSRGAGAPSFPHTLKDRRPVIHSHTNIQEEQD